MLLNYIDASEDQTVIASACERKDSMTLEQVGEDIRFVVHGQGWSVTEEPNPLASEVSGTNTVMHKVV